MKNSIPDRWEEYTNIGGRIKGTRFISFKVPLKKELCAKLVSEELWFTPEMLIDQIKQTNLCLGLVIDLTNTDRYYNYTELEDAGVKHVKVKTAGHVIPGKEIRERFYEAIDTYLSANKDDDDSLIGVHCTHGLNRTGYLICRYMIDRLGFTAEDAITAFNEGRGHSIERENYLSDLKTGKCHEDPEFVEPPQQERYQRDRRNWRPSNHHGESKFGDHDRQESREGGPSRQRRDSVEVKCDLDRGLRHQQNHSSHYRSSGAGYSGDQKFKHDRRNGAFHGRTYYDQEPNDFQRRSQAGRNNYGNSYNNYRRGRGGESHYGYNDYDGRPQRYDGYSRQQSYDSHQQSYDSHSRQQSYDGRQQSYDSHSRQQSYDGRQQSYNSHDRYRHYDQGYQQHGSSHHSQSYYDRKQQHSNHYERNYRDHSKTSSNNAETINELSN